MGSWNKTCGLSNLHITAGKDVLVFPIVENSDKTDRCYTTAFWCPVLLPFYSKYNDYGGGENDSGVGLPYIIEGIKKNLVEMEQGKNEYHDFPITRDKFDVELFYDSVHEGRLWIDAYNGPKKVDFVMFRKDIVDNICKNHNLEMYVGGGRGTSGYDNAYIKYKFSDVVEQSRNYISELTRKIEDDLISGNKMGIFSWTISQLNQSLQTTPGVELISYYLKVDSYRFSNLADITDAIVDLIKNGDYASADAILKDHILAVFLDNFMSSVRKCWMPGGHEGSQETDTASYLTLTKVITDVIEQDEIKYKEMYGEDEVEEADA